MKNTLNKPFFITTTLPYVNGNPHIGFALEVVQADVIARHHRLLGDEVIFNIGTDEHGIKIFEKAEEERLSPQAYCDRMAQRYRDLKNLLDISYTHFIRTTDKQHALAAQEFWKRCETNGDIYKKNYKMRYCVGCELEKTDSDLVDGKCPDHPNRELEIVEEENYFFRFSKYQEALLDLYQKQPDFVVPKKRMNEIAAFVGRGLQDFSISRLAKKMSWGISVPGNEDHVMYVWFDALVNYVSTLSWPMDEEMFKKFWPGLQIAGKDNLRQQSAMWQAMLLSAGLEPSKQVIIHGHITSAGQKMSKSLGNVVSPDELVEKFGKDGTRYILLSAATFGEDIDITWEKMTEKYNADLANGLGNLVSRVIKLSEKLEVGSWSSTLRDEPSGSDSNEKLEIPEFPEEIGKFLVEYKFSEALQCVWKKVAEANRYIDETKPWELMKENETKFFEVMKKLLSDLLEISSSLKPFMPETAEKIKQAIKERKTIPLFERIK